MVLQHYVCLVTYTPLMYVCLVTYTPLNVRMFSNIYATECTYNKQLHFSELRKNHSGKRKTGA
jgi:hypothetical protein